MDWKSEMCHLLIPMLSVALMICSLILTRAPSAIMLRLDMGGLVLKENNADEGMMSKSSGFPHCK